MNSSSLENITFVGLPTSEYALLFWLCQDREKNGAEVRAQLPFWKATLGNKGHNSISRKKVRLVYAPLLLQEPVDMNFLWWPGLYHSSCSSAKFPSDSQSKLGESINFEVCQRPAFSSCCEEVLAGQVSVQIKA